MQEKRDAVRAMLCRNRLSQAWLIFELEKAGVLVDKSSLSEILSGARQKKKAAEVIEAAYVILARYESHYANG